jgi:hypothetical protein
VETSKSYKKYLAEGSLIVFSVLFALFINNLFSNYQTQQRKKIALQSIRQEIDRNHKVLATWQQAHSSIANRLDSIAANPEHNAYRQLKTGRYLDLALLTNNQSLVSDILSNTAWETAKATGIIAEFNFSTTEKLTQVYTMQEAISNGTLQGIVDLYFNSKTHDPAHLDETLLQFQLRFQELKGQENLLAYLYNNLELE